MTRPLILILLLSSNAVFSQKDTVQFITKDIDQFWKAYDLFKQDTSTNPFDTYLDSATAAIQHLRQYAIRDSAEFKRIIKENIPYYEKVRASSDSISNYREKIITYFRNFKALYPEAEIPKVFFTIGQMNVGGTSCPEGVVICMEKFCDTTVINTYGYKSMEMQKLPVVTLTSFMFYQQKPAHTGYNLLRQCIVRGSADFLTVLVLGDEKDLILKQENFTYGEQHEELLVKEFLANKGSDDFSGWLYTRQPDQERPSDLGTWIGYKITEAYYNNATDKQKAIDEILKINDFEKFLVLSGYADIFSK